MTRLGRAVRDILERLLGRYHEGPEPPARLAEMVLVFANAHPRATRVDWVHFAAGHAAECYRTGYARGYGWSERDLGRRDPVEDPEEIMRRHHGDGWLEHPVDLSNPACVVQAMAQRSPAEEQAEHNAKVQAYNAVHGQFQPPPRKG